MARNRNKTGIYSYKCAISSGSGHIWNVVIVLIFTVTLISSFFVQNENLSVTFKITELKKCAAKKFAIHVRLKASLDDCVMECAGWSECKSCNYRRSFKLCEFFPWLEEELVYNTQQTGYCVHVDKSDIVIIKTNDASNVCLANQMYDTNTAACIQQVCPIIQLDNGDVFGNMYETGSRIIYTCHENYVSEHVVEQPLICQANGTWSHNPRCLRDCGEPPSLEINVSPGATTEGATREYICLDTYRMSVDSIPTTSCQSDGSWTEPDIKCVRDYRYVGCFNDSQSERILIDLQVNLFSLNTNEVCIEKCFTLGHFYAFTEAGTWCFCGNEVQHRHREPESDCDKPCHGDISTICGGFWRASLFERNTNENYFGCFKDRSTDPILNESFYKDEQTMTTEACIQFCRNDGKKYALTKIATDCFCGNEVHVIEKLADNMCNVPCIGNTEQFCGGEMAGSLYDTALIP